MPVNVLSQIQSRDTTSNEDKLPTHRTAAFGAEAIRSFNERENRCPLVRAERDEFIDCFLQRRVVSSEHRAGTIVE